MKTVKRLFNVLILLIASINAIGSVLQQPVNNLAKETLPDNASPFNTPQGAQYTFTKHTESNIDRDTSYNLINTRHKTASDRLKQQAASLKEYAKANDYSTEYCFLVDMSIPSGKKRFFVYNMRKDSLEFSSLVAHGFGSYKQDCDDKLVFSNMPYSFKTSLGKYKIGTSYKGTYGLSYKLFGLDSTNNRAFERAIVLHSDLHVPETETYPKRIFQSAGCPAVTPSFLPILGSYIKSSKKPILLWIYN